MTSIGNAGAFAPQPFPRVQTVLSQDAASGAISATDTAAMVNALGNIGAQLTAGATAASTGSAAATGPTTGAPTSMADRVGTAIDGQVANGTLTLDQATELKAAFGQAQAQMHGGHRVHGGHGHHGGGGISALLGTDTATTTDATGAAGTVATTGATNPPSPVVGAAETALQAFVQQFTGAVSGNATYGAGANAAASLRSVMVSLLG